MLEQVLGDGAPAHVRGKVERGAVLARPVPRNLARLRVRQQVTQAREVRLPDRRQ